MLMQCAKCRRFYQGRPGDYTYAAWCDTCAPGEQRADSIKLAILLPSGLAVAWLLAYAVANLP